MEQQTPTLTIPEAQGLCVKELPLIEVTVASQEVISEALS